MFDSLMRDAREVYEKARGLQAQYEGKTLPEGVAQEIDRLLDQVEDLNERAMRVKKLGMDDNTPATSLPTGGARREAQPSGLIPSMEVDGSVKSMWTAFGMDEKSMRPTPFQFDERHAYDPSRSAKHALGVALVWKYGLKGMENVLSALPRELAEIAVQVKDLATSQGSAGGYLVADQQLARLVELQANTSAMRRIATVLPPIAGGSTIFPSEDSELSDAEWTTEIGTGSDDTVKPFGQRSMTPHPLAKRVKVSRTLLRAGTLLDVESWVLSRLARKFTDAEENGFVNGSGVLQPEGLLTKSGITAVSTAAANTLAADDIINWAYSLGDAYAANARILCNRSFLRKVRLLKGTDNNYLWQPGLAQGTPPTILDWPYVTSDQYPTGLTNDAFDNNAIVATIGDFSYYWIVDSLAFEVQRLEELYAATNQVGFIGRKETDGMVVNTAAFRHLKIKSA